MQSQKIHTKAEATKKLENYCAYQERSHMEVIQKLRDMRMSLEDIDQIVVHLIKENYLNEERFARTYARGKFTIKKWGRNRILAELKKRGISKYIMNTALTEIEDKDYYRTFDALAEKKWNSLKEPNLQKRKRTLADYLLYRGWESDLIYSKIADLES